MATEPDSNPPPKCRARIVSQAVIVVSFVEDEHGVQVINLRSFGSPESRIKDAEEFTDSLARIARSIIEDPAKLKEAP